MKYLITLTQSKEDWQKLGANPKAFREGVGRMLETVKPEAVYASVVRRAGFLVVDVKDPHVELRKLYDSLEGMGTATIEPIDTMKEFGAFLESL